MSLSPWVTDVTMCVSLRVPWAAKVAYAPARSTARTGSVPSTLDSSALVDSLGIPARIATSCDFSGPIATLSCA